MDSSTSPQIGRPSSFGQEAESAAQADREYQQSVQRERKSAKQVILDQNLQSLIDFQGKDEQLGSEAQFKKTLDNALIQQCICGIFKAKTLQKAVEKQCLRCCAEHIEEARQYDPAKGSKSALMKASKRGLFEVIKLLLFYQKDFADKNGYKADYYATNSIARAIIAKAEVDSGDSYGILLQKAKNSSCVCAKLSTNLYEAVCNNCLKCVSKYVGQAKKKVNDETALMKAAEFGFTDIVKLLAHKEAMSGCKNGRTALMTAVQFGRVDAVKALIPFEGKMQRYDGVTALMHATQKGDPECTSLLLPLEAGMRQENGTTALMTAALQGHAEVVKLLIPVEAGKTKTPGISALMMAAKRGYADVVELLVPKEAKMTGKDGITALMIAAESGFRGVVQVLLPYEVKKTMLCGVTALMLAAKGGHSEIVEQLIPQEAGMAAKDGLTALMFCALSGQQWCLQPLISVEKGLKDGKGECALWKTYCKCDCKYTWGRRACAQVLWKIPEERDLLTEEQAKLLERRYELE